MNADTPETPDPTASSTPFGRQSDAPIARTVLGDIINQQLQVMARQLEILRGAPTSSQPKAASAQERNAESNTDTLGQAHAVPAIRAANATSDNVRHTPVDDSPPSMPWQEDSGFEALAVSPETTVKNSTPPTSSDDSLRSSRDDLKNDEFVETDSVARKIEAILNAHSNVMFSRVLMRNDEASGRQIIAYIVERNEGRTDGADETSYWRGVWEGMHHSSIVEAGTGGDPTHAFLRSIKIENPEEQERQFTFQTADRVRALGATSVYEIGCGTGGLVRALHPHCHTFWASDFSESAVSYLSGQLSGTDGNLPGGVKLFHRAADDFTGIHPESFDLILIHSVVQYFPDVAYLLRVIDGAIHSTRSGGCVYLGAIQNLASYEAYHTNLQAQRAPADLPVGELKKRVRKRLDSGEEFTIDPGFFRVLSRQNSRIAAVDIRLRRGDYHNKSTKFLYDAILHVEETPVHIHVNNWQTLGDAGLPEIRRLLEAQKPETIGFRSLLNSRLQGEIDRFRLIVAADPATPLRQVLLSANPKLNTVDPEHLWRLGESLGYQVHINWAADGNPSGMDAVFTRRIGIVDFPDASGLDSARGLAAYVSSPHSQTGHYSKPGSRTMTGDEAAQMREYLRTRLPENMIPDVFVAVAEIPLTPEGKINVCLLPEPANQKGDDAALLAAS